MIYKDKLKQLRDILPIGIKQGLEILGKVEGNIEKAKLKFCQDQVNLFKEMYKISEDVALKHLQKHNFDLYKAIDSLETEQHTLTELILRKYSNKEEALYKILNIIETQEGLETDFWLTQESLNKLNPYQFCLAVILVWLDFEDYEGFDYSLNFRLEITLLEITNKLQLVDFADNLSKAAERKRKIELTYKGKKDYTYINNKLIEDKVFRHYKDYFTEQKSVLIHKLYEFVEQNIRFYP